MTKYLKSLCAIAAATFVAGIVSATTLTSDLRSDQEITLAPEPHLGEATKWATTFLTRVHYKKTVLDDKMSSQILDTYIDNLDPNRVFFLASDIRAFEAYRQALDDSLGRQDLKPAFDIFNVYRHRVNERVTHAIDLLDYDFDFSIDETLELDRSELPWANNREELDDLWRKRVKNDVLRLRLAKKESDAINETLDQRYSNLRRRVQELDSEDVFQYFMNSYANSIEPHTGYLAPRTSDNFQISMRLSLEGIGAVLQRDNEYTTIRHIVPGGPAQQMGELKAGDRILAVGQDEGDAPVDVIGWRLDDVVEMIRGPAGTRVRLDIIPADASLESPAETIWITRDKVKLEEQAARKDIYEVEHDGRTERIGVIDLPAFYLDFAGRARNEPDYRSSTRDVRRLIKELKAEGITGLVIDLRNNGGGSLDEATDLTGLFIEDGPVVQVRNSDGNIEVSADSDKGIEWDGPMAVLVNRNSASASEIFAAAIQDYGRGVIVGEPTFGKGTVQNLINLDRYGRNPENRYGQLKLTVAQFFRVTGGSTQHRGVIPDIVFPTFEAGEEYGESALESALPWTSIKPARYKIHDDLSAILPAIGQRSEQRVQKNVQFSFLLEDLALFRQNRDETNVSLLESQRRSELDAEDQRREARKAAREAWDEKVADGTRIPTVFPVMKIEDELAEEAKEPIDEPSDEEATEDEEIERPDVLLNETVRVVGDMIDLIFARQQTAQLQPKPAAPVE